MAEQQKDAAENEAPAKSKKMIWILLAVVLLAGGGGGAYWFLAGNKAAPVDGENPDVETEVAAEPVRDPNYLAMEKLLVNFDYQGSTRYVQTEMQLMAYDEAALAKASLNMPAVRNRLIMLLSEQDFAALRTVQGKEALRQSIAVAVNEVLTASGGAAIDDVFFTSFVLQ
ncbi:MAG: flagellar basal body-associated protein FliL [Parahaliea sp.]